MVDRPNLVIDPDDRARMERQAIQWAIAHSDWDSRDKVVTDFMGRLVHPDRLAKWGPPDTSGNFTANVARQLSVGGLYDRPPRVGHAGIPQVEAPDLPPDAPPEVAQARADWIAAETARLWAETPVCQFLTLAAQVGAWRTGQERIRKAVAMGDCLVATGWNTRTKRPYLRFVRPQDVVVHCDRDDPERPVVLGELATRVVAGKPECVWEVYNISGDVPSFRVYVARKADADRPWGEEVPTLTREGADYGWIATDGSPRIPVVRYCTLDTLTYWHDLWVRDSARGTLFGITLWTYAHRCARDATGSKVFAVDVERPAGSATNVGTADHVESVQMDPGEVAFCNSSKTGTKQPMIVVVPPAVNLKDIVETALTYEAQNYIRQGVKPSNIQRTNNDPTSGAALAINDAGRREFGRSIMPMFTDADQQLLELLAIACSTWGDIDAPQTGYSITYDVPPESPQAQRERREQQTWDLANGQKSEVDVYIANNPGATEEVAIRELVRIARQKRLIADMAKHEPTPAPKPPASMSHEDEMDDEPQG